MEITTYCKCACANCGYIIDYRASQAGQVIVCPKCSEKSLLPEPEKLLLVESFGPPIPEFRNCPTCNAQLKFYARSCDVCDSRKKRKRLQVVAVILVIFGVLLFTIVPIVFKRLRSKKARENAVLESIAAAAKSNSGGSYMLIEPPRAATVKSTNDLVVRRFALERHRDNDLILAVGDVDNVSQNSHMRLRADLDLLDKTGKKIGSVSDYCTQLGPYQSWHFLATITDTNAASLRFASLHEEK